MEPKENQIITEDESELDAALDQSISTLKAGQSLSEETPETQTGATGSQEGSDEEPTQPTGATGEDDGDSQNKGVTANDDGGFKMPVKRADESDAAFEKRYELAVLVKQRKEAPNQEAKDALSKKIDATRKQYGRIDSMDKFIQPKPENTTTPVDEDPGVLADRERAKELGFVTKEDIDNYLQEQRFADSVQTTLNNFVDKTPELADPDALEVFFQFVDENYVWQGKTGKELETTLALAKEAMFKQNETVQDRALKGAELQKKVGAMQFPGGTGSVVGLPADKRNSINELKSIGMSEEMAAELISED